VERPGRRQSLGRVSDALVALDVLNRVFADAHRDDLASRLLRRVRDEASPTGAAAALSAVLAALESAASGHAAARELVQQLTDALRGIAGVFPPPRSAESAHVVASAFAGLLLLVPTIVRLGWLQALRKTRVWQAHGARTLTYVLAGVASELVGREGDALDPGAALLAGWIGEPDVAGFRRFVERLDGGACAELAHALALAEAHDATTLTTQAADRLVAEFAARIRGFGTAGRAFVVDKLLAVAGEIVIDERRVTVALAACPYHVALHVCSAFESLGAVEWLGGRELVFRPGAA
ncbi:MAG TPA: hypothetical protein VKB52_11600, partial [Rhodanobacteraceae bacterium]|nr:hypothetical protein [Rhodanobacteraceae bacterium]